jgi:transitional endoplasmic reticulum ATPase
MSKDLSTIVNDYVTAEVVRSGEKLLIPEEMSIKRAIEMLQEREAFEKQTVNISETFDVFPWDGAIAFAQVLTDTYGWAPHRPTPGFWGDQPPELITVSTDWNQTTQVPWGMFGLPNIDGLIQTGAQPKDGRYQFALTASVKRSGESVVKKLFADLRVRLLNQSIYRGKAFKLRFRNDNGKALGLPEPKFLRVDDIDESGLIYSKHVQDAIENNLFTPIKRVRELKDNGIPVKRGVLLGGPFGTGKTLAAKVASKIAVETGVTFIYISRADELPDAIQFAKQYQDPACVIFCEDIDRVMSGTRDVKMDDILNIVDGIDTKSQNLIIVLTTNALENINPAMLRPGRLDAVVHVERPDAEATARLIRYYGGDAIDPSADLTHAGVILSGQIPAVVHEVVKRSKLAQLKLNAPNEPVKMLSAQAIEEAAHSIQKQAMLLDQNEPEQAVTVDSTLADLIDHRLDTKFAKRDAEMMSAIQQIKEALC